MIKKVAIGCLFWFLIMLVPLTIYKFGKACDNRIQDGCDEYNRLKAFKAQTVYIVPSKPYQPDEVYVTPDKEEFYEAELRAIQRQEQAELSEAEYRSDLAEIEAAQAELKSIMRQVELLD